MLFYFIYLFARHLIVYFVMSRVERRLRQSLELVFSVHESLRVPVSQNSVVEYARESVVFVVVVRSRLRFEQVVSELDGRVSLLVSLHEFVIAVRNACGLNQLLFLPYGLGSSALWWCHYSIYYLRIIIQNA